MSNNDPHPFGPLGKTTDYESQYNPELLFPIPRQGNRDKLNISEHQAFPFKGVDLWTAYELSWLNENGKPMVCGAEFFIPATSPNIIESKSFKLYLNSFNQTSLKNHEELSQRLTQDLSKAADSPIKVKLFDLDHAQSIKPPPGISLDDLDIKIKDYTPNKHLLELKEHENATSENDQKTHQVYSHLLKSNCPVTGQPDWATVMIEYTGQEIKAESLLAYIISYRNHNDFHEHCVESIYTDIMSQCQPQALSVYARYVRRGGLDINPFRSSHREHPMESLRLIRQ